MVLIISQIPFDEFTQLDSQKEYATQNDFFCLFKDSDKKAILNRYIYLLYLYPTFSKKDLYITLMKNVYFDKLNIDLSCTSDLITCSVIPESLEDEHQHPDKYHRYTDKLFNDNDVNRTVETLLNIKLTDEQPIITTKINHKN